MLFLNIVKQHVPPKEPDQVIRYLSNPFRSGVLGHFRNNTESSFILMCTNSESPLGGFYRWLPAYIKSN